MKILSIKVRPELADEIQRAADEAGLSRHAWIVAMLRIASGSTALLEQARRATPDSRS